MKTKSKELVFGLAYDDSIDRASIIVMVPNVGTVVGRIFQGDWVLPTGRVMSDVFILQRPAPHLADPGDDPSHVWQDVQWFRELEGARRYTILAYLNERLQGEW